MKPYLLFHGDVYYPSGGWGDFGGDFSTLLDAQNVDTPSEYTWAHVVEREKQEIVSWRDGFRGWVTGSPEW